VHHHVIHDRVPQRSSNDGYGVGMTESQAAEAMNQAASQGLDYSGKMWQSYLNEGDVIKVTWRSVAPLQI
jgi:hypothetical protein